MKPAKPCLTVYFSTSSQTGKFMVAPTSSPVARTNFRDQIKRWLSNYGSKVAEQRFLATYLPMARLVPEEEAGLTDGLVFEYGGDIFWDAGYETRSMLDVLVAMNEAFIRNTGPRAGVESAKERK
jgi:hypothetical protein